MGRGVYVNARVDDLQWPPLCASCGGPEQIRLLAQGGAVFKSTKLSIPYCVSCQRRVGTLASAYRFAFATGAGLAVTALICIVLAKLPFVLLLIAAVVVATAVAAAAAVLAAGFGPPHAASDGCAVSLTASRAGNVELFCANRDWAQALAAASGGEVREDKRLALGRPGLLAIGTSIALGAAGSLIGWRMTRCPLTVDNPTTESLVIFFDGDPILTVLPNPRGVEPPETYVLNGAHQLGYAVAGEHVPTKTVDVSLSRTQSLYNPGKTACYAKLISVYSTGFTQQQDRLDLPKRSEFYAPGAIDHWFEAAPTTIEMNADTKVATRSSWVRNTDCTKLALAGCTEKVLDGLMQCQLTAATAERIDECAQNAARECKVPLVRQ